MRIDNLWRIRNNTNDTTWAWIFDGNATVFAAVWKGHLHKLSPGDFIDIEIDLQTAKIGFRDGETVFNAWQSDPVAVDTDRDVSLEKGSDMKFRIAFPEHAMFDRTSVTKNVQFMSPAETNDLARMIVLAGLGKIPQAGGIISSIVGLIWAEQKPTMESLIKQSEARMRSWVRGQIDMIKRENLKNFSIGLSNNLQEYMLAKTPAAKQEKLSIVIGHFGDKMPFFTNENYTVGTLAAGVEVASMHIALLRERIIFAKQLGIPDEERDGHIQILDEKISAYQDHVLNIAIPAEIKWRMDNIDREKIPHVGGYNHYLRDHVSRQIFFYADKVIGNSRNSHNSVINRNYYLRQAETSYTNSLLTNVGDAARLWSLLKGKPETLQPVSLDRLAWVGPCTGLIHKGGNQHGAVEDVKLETHGDIAEVIVRAKDEINYLKLVYRNGSSKAIGKTNDGSEYKVTLKEGVYVTKIETWWDWELMAISFHLSDGTVTPVQGKTRADMSKQIASLDNHIMSGFKAEGNPNAKIGNALSFAFVPHPDFYQVKDQPKPLRHNEPAEQEKVPVNL